MSLFYGGKSEGDRHFRVVKLDGKEVEIGGVSITQKASPGDAARKLLSSIAHEKGLKKNKKLELGKVKFSIQEYTQGSKKKVYGPYEGHFHKYTAEELKKARTAGGKQAFTMRPMIKLNKNSKSMNTMKKMNKNNKNMNANMNKSMNKNRNKNANMNANKNANMNANMNANKNANMNANMNKSMNKKKVKNNNNGINKKKLVKNLEKLKNLENNLINNLQKLKNKK
jgi:hypothetical protein